MGSETVSITIEVPIAELDIDYQADRIEETRHSPGHIEVEINSICFWPAKTDYWEVENFDEETIKNYLAERYWEDRDG